MPLNCSDPLFCYLLIQKWESQTRFICTQRWELPPCSVILDKALLNCPGQKQFEWSSDCPYNAIWFWRGKFCEYLSITFLSAAVFNCWRSLTTTCTGKSGTQKSKPWLFLPLLRDFLYGQGHTAVHRLFLCAKSAGSAPTGIPRAPQTHL